MEKAFQAVYSGILYGSVYGLIAIGLTLIWGSLRMLNLAHGSLYLVGAYIAYLFVTWQTGFLQSPVMPYVWTVLVAAGAISVILAIVRHERVPNIVRWVAAFLVLKTSIDIATALINWAPDRLPLILSFLLAVIGAGITGFLIQFLMVDRILGKPGWDTASLIVTVGASIMLQSATLLIFGPQRKYLPPLIEGHFKIGSVLIINHQLSVIVLAVISLVLLSMFLQRTRYGLAIQAVSQHMDAARLMGIPVRTVFWLVMAISAALAGLAGVLLSSVYDLSPTSGYDPMTRALVVTIFGGLGSVKGTIWAAFIIGLLESAMQVYLGAGLAIPGLFLFMMIMLVILPNGLFGVGEGQRL